MNISAGACFRGSEITIKFEEFSSQIIKVSPAISPCKGVVTNDALLEIIPPVSIVLVNKVLEGSASDSAAENKSEEETNHGGEAHDQLILRLSLLLTLSRIRLHDLFQNWIYLEVSKNITNKQTSFLLRAVEEDDQ